MYESELDRFQRYAKDPWAFLSECVFTNNQIADGETIQKFPDWDYLKLYTMLWQRHKRIAVPKSRRMLMSWTNIPLYLWKAIFHPGQLIAFVSKKEDDSHELLKRAEFVFDHIPEDRIPKSLLPKKDTRAKPPQLIFSDIDSKIQGFPMGADQLRQFTFSGILGDECAFWDDAQRFYKGAKPTLDGGGNMTLISSRHPSFFQRLVYDRFDDEETIDETITPPQLRPFNDDSVIIWKNPKNKFLVVDIHYTANPNKRDHEYIQSIREEMPLRDFLSEYERNWVTFDGKSVYADYNKERHESKVPIDPRLGLPLLLGWDFGLTPACVVAQYREGRLYVLKEYVAEHQSIDKFCPLVMSDLAIRYPQWRNPRTDMRHYIDPAGLAESATDQRTCAGVMSECGLKNIFPGPIDFESRRQAVEHFLITLTKDGPALQLHPADAPFLAKGFAGGYRYPDRYAEIEPGKPRPIKDQYSHPHDAFQYLCAGALALKNSKRHAPIPIPRYSFSEGESKKKDTSSEYTISKNDLRGIDGKEKR